MAGAGAGCFVATFFATDFFATVFFLGASGARAEVFFVAAAGLAAVFLVTILSSAMSLARLLLVVHCRRSGDLEP